MPRSEKLARMPEPPLPKGKGTKPSVRSLDREVAESQGERELHLVKKEGDQSGSMGRKG